MGGRETPSYWFLRLPYLCPFRSRSVRGCARVLILLLVWDLIYRLDYTL
jgi:hypothetical protein